TQPRGELRADLCADHDAETEPSGSPEMHVAEQNVGCEGEGRCQHRDEVTRRRCDVDRVAEEKNQNGNLQHTTSEPQEAGNKSQNEVQADAQTLVRIEVVTFPEGVDHDDVAQPSLGATTETYGPIDVLESDHGVAGEPQQEDAEDRVK